MKCPKCQTQNDEDAGFCKSCGLNLNLQIQEKNDKKYKGDIFVFVSIAIMVCNRIYWMLISANYLWDTMKIPSIIVSIIVSSLPIVISFSLKQKPAKIICLVIGVLYFLVNTYQILFIES